MDGRFVWVPFLLQILDVLILCFHFFLPNREERKALLRKRLEEQKAKGESS